MSQGLSHHLQKLFREVKGKLLHNKSLKRYLQALEIIDYIEL